MHEAGSSRFTGGRLSSRCSSDVSGTCGGTGWEVGDGKMSSSHNRCSPTNFAAALNLLGSKTEKLIEEIEVGTANECKLTYHETSQLPSGSFWINLPLFWSL